MKCPYCNSDPEIKEVHQTLRVKCESSAQNIELVREVYDRRTGKFCYHVYDQTAYIIRCSNRKCLAYHLNKRFWSKDAAYLHWNNRKFIPQ